MKRYKPLFPQTTVPYIWTEEDEHIYDMFREYVIKTEYGTKLQEFGIPKELKDKIIFLKDLAKETGLKLFDLFKLFLKKDVFKFFQLIGWSFSKLLDLLK